LSSSEKEIAYTLETPKANTVLLSHLWSNVCTH